jgi:3-oxoacyl-[acyl-carrier-protein] synthase-3
MSLLRGESYLHGPVHFLPARKIDNDTLARSIEEASGQRLRGSWIKQKTGVETRYWVEDSQATSDLALGAARRLITRHEPGQPGQIILATTSGDYLSPPTSCLLQRELGLGPLPCFDLGAACSGFVHGLQVATAFVGGGGGRQLLISADVRSKFLDPGDFATVTLFGDAGAACWVDDRREGATFRVIATSLDCDASFYEVLMIPAGGSRAPAARTTDPKELNLRMRDGAIVFTRALRGMAEGTRAFLDRLRVPAEQVAWVVPHQANGHLVRELARELAFPQARFAETISEVGNTSGSSIAVALSLLLERESFRRGDLIVLTTAGAGGSVGFALLEAL